MSEEFQVEIKVSAYRDRNGLPTCAIDFETGKVCMFYRTQRFGCLETCVFGETVGRYSESLRRRPGTETLIPLDNCPVHAKKPKETPTVQSPTARFAASSMHAHLLKLVSQGKARQRTTKSKCEKCNKLTPFEVLTGGRWAAWCGCR